MNPTRQIRYLVQSADGYLHGYDREDILACDLAMNREDPPIQIFRLSETALTVRYDPISIADVLEPSETSISLNQLPAVKQLAA